MTDEPEELTPIASRALATLARLGGTIVDTNGRAGVMLAESIPGSYTRTSVSAALRLLEARGLITRDVQSKRTYNVTMTAAGMELAPLPPPEPDPLPLDLDQSTAVATIVGAGSADEPTRVNSNGHGHALPPLRVEGPPQPDVSASDIAAALLRQATRVLSDSDVVTLTAERDALAVHNASLAARLAAAEARADRAEAEAREARGVLHGIEVQLTPLLVGRDARFEWLDASTRTDLLRLVGQAAEWAAS